jgi:hypothetical protein
VADNKVSIKKFPLSDYVDRLNKNEPYSFSRWGDGEWRALLKKPGRNVDGHRYFPAMGKELIEVLTTSPPKLRLGLQSLALRVFNEEINWFCDKHSVPKVWENADVFHSALINKQHQPLMDALSKKTIIMVGPQHLSKFKEFKVRRHILVPDRDCYTAMSRIMKEINDSLSRCPDGTVVAISASMPAELMVHRLYNKWGSKHFLIDFGSLWDPFVKVNSRTYHKRLKL